MKVKIIKRVNPANREEELFHLAPVFGVQIGLDELAEEISFASSANQSDVKAVLSNLLEILPRHLMRGDSVNLESFGIFRMGLRSKGVKKEEDVTVQNIARLKILFKPSTKLKDKISTTSFVQQ